MAEKRRTHSTLDKLPAKLLAALRRMVIDDVWPDDYTGEHKGRPTYDDLVDYCGQKGFRPSRSSVARWAKRLSMLSRMRTASAIVRDTMGDLTAEKASETQKAVAEMITAQTIDFIASSGDMNAVEIQRVARAMKDCTAVSINADKYIREQIEAKVKKACESTKAKLKKEGLDRKKIQEIIDEHLGVVKS